MKKHLKNTLYYAAAIAIGKGISFLMIPIITRQIPIDEYGVLEIIMALCDIGSIMLGLGLAESLYRFAGTASSITEKKKVAANLFSLSLYLCIVFIVIGQLLTPYIHSLLPAEIDIINIRIVMVTLALTSCIMIPLSWLRMQDRAALFLALSAGKAVMQTGLILLFLYYDMGITAILLGGLITDLILVGILIYLQWKDTKISFSYQSLYKFVPYSFPLIIAGIAEFFLGSCNRFILAANVSIETLAIYGIAAKFALATALLIEPFNMWWIPRRFQTLSEDNGKIQSAYAVNIGLAYIIAVSLFIAIIGPICVILLTPEPYHAATQYIPIMSFIMGVHYSTNIINIGCYIHKNTILPTAINIFSAVVAITAYMWLIPIYGIEGAIIAALIAYVTRFFIFYFTSQYYVSIPYAVKRLLLLLLVYACSVLYIQQYQGLWVSYILNGGITISLLIILMAAMDMTPIKFANCRKYYARQKQ